MLKVENVSKNFGSVIAVNNVSFEIKQGEIVGFLGPNGAGKTTLMRIITTYFLPTSGEVYVDGISVVKEPLSVRKIIGYLPENNILYYSMRVDKFLYFVGEARGLNGNYLEERFQYCIEACRLTDVLKKRISECSRGYRQRIALAAAIIHNPKLIILDEPTIGLDPLQILAFRDLILSLSGNRSVLFSSHVLQEVSAMTDRIIIIDKGYLIADFYFKESQNRVEKLEQLFTQAIQEHQEVKE